MKYNKCTFFATFTCLLVAYETYMCFTYATSKSLDTYHRCLIPRHSCPMQYQIFIGRFGDHIKMVDILMIIVYLLLLSALE